MKRHVRLLLIFSLVFVIIYKFSLWYASGLSGVTSFVFTFDQYLPFLPWTIIPYLSSGVFFCGIFWLFTSRRELNVFFKRVILITVIAGLAFVFLPLQYSFPKPAVENPVFSFLFGLLDSVDDPYNQSPSLHVAFAFAFWTVFRGFALRWRMLAGFWLILVGISTLTTFQHHLIDIFTGSILAHFSFIVFPIQPRGQTFRNLHVANFYFLGAWLTVFFSLLLADYYAMYWLHLCWLALAMFVMGYLYQRNVFDAEKEKLPEVFSLRRSFSFLENQPWKR